MSLRTVTDIAAPHRPQLSLAAFFMFAEAAAALTVPWLGGLFAAGVFTGQSLAHEKLVLLLLAVFAVQAMLKFCATYFSGRIAQRIASGLRLRLYEHLQALPLSYFNARRRGDVLALLTNDAARIAHYVTGTLLNVGPMAILLAGALLLMSRIDLRLTLAIALCLPAFYLVLKIIGRRIRPLAIDIQNEDARLVALAEENLAVLPVIKAFTREPAELRRFEEQSTHLLKLNLAQQRIYAALEPAIQFIAAAAAVLVLWLAASRDATASLAPNEMVSFLLYAALLTRPVANLAAVYGQTQGARGAFQRIEDVLGEVREPLDASAKPAQRLKGAIAFEAVTFAYPGRPATLDGATFSVKAGETVAITGANGAGKSTLAHLLMRLYEPQSGRIAIDGTGIAAMSLSDLRAEHRSRLPARAALQRQRSRQHRAWQGRRRSGRDRGRGTPGRSPRFHFASAPGIRHGHRRQRRAPLGRPAPAHRARPRPHQGAADPDPRRSHRHVRSRRRTRLHCPQQNGAAKSHRDPDYAPAREPGARRPDLETRKRALRRGLTTRPMSGIAGIIHFDGKPADPALIRRMTDAMAYRGPDGIHHFVRGNVALGHLMLHTTPESLEETQPLTNEDESLVLVMDGRVDNWEELRRELLQHGARLRTRADAELVLRAYETWGEDCLSHIDGDFAIAIWNEKTRELFCARDRVGNKPFTYHFDGTTLVFASELHALLELPWVPQVPNEGMIAEIIADEWMTRDETIWKEIYRLIASHRLNVSERGKRDSLYWRPDIARSLPYKRDEDYNEHYRELFFDVVRRQSRSHKPIAYEVSGGLNSSSIFCVAETLKRGARLPAPGLGAYTLAFHDDPNANETSYAHMVGNYLGLPIRETDAGLPRALLVRRHRTPLSRYSRIP